MSAVTHPSASATQLADATPSHRDRYVDLLRAMSIAVVVLGHWLIAVVTYDEGRLGGQHVLEALPATQWLTWVLQVMPVFFLVGGFSNAASWAAARRDGRGYTDWLRSRLDRLVRPTAVFVVTWTVLAAVLASSGLDPATVRLGAQLVAVPLWFLAVYVGVVALAPPMVALHDRFGVRTVMALIAGAIVVDVADLALGVPLIGWTNFLFVWLAIHQLGIVWRDGRLARRHAVWLVVVGLGALVLLTTVGSYPRSMVGVPGAARTNNSPPTVALIALALWQTGLVLGLRDVADRWLARRRVWVAVVAANGMAMTVYLWHLTAMVLVAALVVPTGMLPDAPIGSGSWWGLRAVWLSVLTVGLVPFVAAFARFERPRRGAGRQRPPAAAAVIVGVVALCAGLALFTLQGFHVPSNPGGAPLLALTAMAVALSFLRLGRPGARR